MTPFKRPPSPTSSSSQPAAKRSTQAAGLFALPGSASRSPASSIAGYTSRRHVPGPVKRASEIGATKQRATSTREKGAEVLVLSDDSEEEVKVRGGKEEKGKGKAPARPSPDPEDKDETPTSGDQAPAVSGDDDESDADDDEDVEEEPLAELNAAEVEAHKLFVDSYVVPYIEEVVSKLNTEQRSELIEIKRRLVLHRGGAHKDLYRVIEREDGTFLGKSTEWASPSCHDIMFDRVEVQWGNQKIVLARQDVVFVWSILTHPHLYTAYSTLLLTPEENLRLWRLTFPDVVTEVDMRTSERNGVYSMAECEKMPSAEELKRLLAAGTPFNPRAYVGKVGTQFLVRFAGHAASAVSRKVAAAQARLPFEKWTARAVFVTPTDVEGTISNLVLLLIEHQTGLSIDFTSSHHLNTRKVDAWTWHHLIDRDQYDRWWQEVQEIALKTGENISLPFFQKHHQQLKINAPIKPQTMMSYSRGDGWAWRARMLTINPAIFASNRMPVKLCSFEERERRRADRAAREARAGSDLFRASAKGRNERVKARKEDGTFKPREKSKVGSDLSDAFGDF